MAKVITPGEGSQRRIFFEADYWNVSIADTEDGEEEFYRYCLETFLDLHPESKFLAFRVTLDYDHGDTSKMDFILEGVGDDGTLYGSLESTIVSAKFILTDEGPIFESVHVAVTRDHHFWNMYESELDTDETTEVISILVLAAEKLIS